MVAPAPLSAVDLESVPHHVAIIMDGNGRWAKARGLERTKGHEMGETALFEAIEGALGAGVRVVTVYAFSTENWQRPKNEVKFLLNFNRSLLRRRRDELNERGVRIRFVGRRNWRVPRSVLKDMEAAEDLTKTNTGLDLVIAFNYGGRAEIVDAVKELIAAGTDANSIEERAISKQLYAPELGEPELMIRTSGESRLSNFLLWQLAYSELLFSEVLWPDFTREHFWGALAEFQGRERRFGGV